MPESIRDRDTNPPADAVCDGSSVEAKRQPSFRVLAANTAWLLSVQVARIAIGVTVGLWVARFLGPDQWGLLSYAISLVGMLAPLASPALDAFVVRDLVRSPEQEQRILATVLVLKLLASLVVGLLGIGLALLLRPGQSTVLVITAVVAVSLVFRSSQTLELFFRARVENKAVAIAQLVGVVANAGLSVCLVLAGASVGYFALPLLVEVICSGATLAAAYRASDCTFGGWRTERAMMKQMVAESWPMVLSNAIALVYLQIDQVMLGQMVDDHAVGVYSAVVTLSAGWYFVPNIMCQVVQPSIVQAREAGRASYHRQLQSLFTVLAGLAYAVAIPVSLCSTVLINLLYGSDYSSGGPVLAIHIFAAVFIFVGVPSRLWVVNESHAKHTLAASLAASCVNVGLNVVLIPRWGPLGAAYATLVSYFVAYVLMTCVFPGGREIMVMQIRALLLLDLPQMLLRRL